MSETVRVLSQGVPHRALDEREIVWVINRQFGPWDDDFANLKYKETQGIIRKFLSDYDLRSAVMADLITGSVLLSLSFGKALWRLPEPVEVNSRGRHIFELGEDDERTTGECIISLSLARSKLHTVADERDAKLGK